MKTGTDINYQKKKVKNISKDLLIKDVSFGIPIREVWLDMSKAGESIMNNSVGLFVEHRSQRI